MEEGATVATVVAEARAGAVPGTGTTCVTSRVCSSQRVNEPHRLSTAPNSNATHVRLSSHCRRQEGRSAVCGSLRVGHTSNTPDSPSCDRHAPVRPCGFIHLQLVQGSNTHQDRGAEGGDRGGGGGRGGGGRGGKDGGGLAGEGGGLNDFTRQGGPSPKCGSIAVT
eukprot:6210011-Pleurochrysis_carterae.AAC.4